MATEQTFDFGDVTLNCLIDGPTDGPLAICLHGFPDTRHSFRFLTPELVKAGYRVVAPALRGYAPSSLAHDGDYHMSALADDVARLHDALGGDGQSVLIGHDWGAGAAYGVSAVEPERFRRVVTMAVPPIGFIAQSFGHVEQLRASWYMWFFQLPMADAAVAMNDFQLIDALWQQWSPGYDDHEERGYIRSAMGSPERVAAVIGYYRAMFSGPPEGSAHARFAGATPAPTVPTLYLHGADDGCMVSRDIRGAIDFLPPGSRVEVIDRAGHFALLEQPDVVNRYVTAFLGA